jgi:hypothetical protein
MQGIERHEYIWKDFYPPYLIGSINTCDFSSDFLFCECATSSRYGSFYSSDLRAQRDKHVFRRTEKALEPAVI